MPSFKTILASIALVALSFSSVSASSVHHNGGVVRRSNIAARDVSPSPAVARRAAAAKALKKRAMFKGKASSIMTGTKLAAIARRIRCGQNTVCQNRAPLGPANSANVCYRGTCAYACNTGFAQQGDQCVATLAANQQCGGVTCDTPANGYALCNNGACEVGCNLGFTRYSTNGSLSGPYTCIDTANDATRCGTGANLVNCPASYNGLGTPECRNSVCRIACPTGSVLRRADSTSNPYYCYNGEGSLAN
ncbi:hypothetical protein JCM3775_007093 [Rhodotorula graminis]|uniref:Uncharacterized protein n=1 Tax=Rhodotorula graminis (strain WP1) TaxID=578459 RepID=A0A194SDJ6_RHOGW|nr:uncharacterized protein RHOBADRAFT_64440 [Rhodotorula graminis WP1]KPV78667.1 hypothetical protein RHOBADRAFT_64440 [Rhodotorula graminis WP1]